MSLKSKLNKLERVVESSCGGICPGCRDGEYPFVINRWMLDGGGHRDQPERSTVYNSKGRCKSCGAACVDCILLVLPEFIGKSRTESAFGEP